MVRFRLKEFTMLAVEVINRWSKYMPPTERPDHLYQGFIHGWASYPAQQKFGVWDTGLAFEIGV
jgi:hypothetical protein